jgi:MFS family permease
MAPSKQPWWIPPFLGRVPPDVPAPQVRLLGTVALAICFENYDQAMLTQAIRQIADSFDLVEAEFGRLLGLVRLGAVPAFLLVPLADRIGRRRLFLGSVLGMSAATVLSALARDANEFIALQMLGRTFMVTSAATAYVIVTEEFPRDHRGFGIGILGAVGTFGVGLSAILFAGIDLLPFGWRAMYVVGVVPILLLPRLRRQVSETRRFHRQRADQQALGEVSGVLRGWWRPLAGLVFAYPARTAGVALIGAGYASGTAVAYNFSAYFVQAEHGWEPGQYSLMLLVAGTVGIIGHPFAGRLADRRGRRLVGLVFFAVFPLLSLLFYRGPGWLLPLVWVPMIFALTGGSTIARALATELFPTSHRGTASGWLQLLETLGAAAGLFAVSWLTAEGESAIPAVELVSFSVLVAALAVVALPETGRRELEEISAER